MYLFSRVGQCLSCLQPEMLFVNENGEDFPNTMIKEACRYCIAHHRLPDDSHQEIQELAGYHGGLTENDICFACLLPEVTKEPNDVRSFNTRATLVDAVYAYSVAGSSNEAWKDDELSVRVHQGCTGLCCDSCGKRYAQLNARPFNGFDVGRSRRSYNWGQNAPHRDLLESNSAVIYPRTAIKKLDGEGDLCNECFDKAIEEYGGMEDHTACNQCSTYCQTDNMYSHNGAYYCEGCEEEYWRWCDECDESYHVDDRWEHDHDDNNDDEYSNSCIHNYSYKPNPVFFGTDKFHMGFELEVEAKGNTNRYDGAELVQGMLGAHAYMKEDGSLEEGFEIVTHPHALSVYQKEFDWSFAKQLVSKGFRSWNANTCGIHVHVSRSGFGEVGDRNPITGRVSYQLPLEKRILARQAHELRFIKLIYDNQRQVERIAGRSSQFATFTDKGRLVRKVKQGWQEDGHYSAVNTSNPETLEVRVFKGSLKPERVLSALEFVHAATEYTRDLKVTGKNRALSWLKFCAFVANNDEVYPNLATTIDRVFGSDTITDNE